MHFTRKLALAACAVSCLAIGGASLAQAAPGAGLGQAAPSVLAPETSTANSLVEKAWWHHCWHCGGWGWHHWHHWHHW
jgi:hypothetical protein